MSIKEVHNRLGSLSNYLVFIILVFCWYFLDNVYNSMAPLVPGSSLETLLYWGYRLVAIPLLVAGVYGGINIMQGTQEISGINAFFDGIKTNYWRMAGANLLSTFFNLFVTLIALISGGAQQPDLSDNKLLLALISIPYSAISLFWFVGIVTERKIFRGLFRGIRTVFSNPFALAVGILWCVFSFTETLVTDLQTSQTAFVVNGVSAGVLAIARVLERVMNFQRT